MSGDLTLHLRIEDSNSDPDLRNQDGICCQSCGHCERAEPGHEVNNCFCTPIGMVLFNDRAFHILVLTKG